MPASLSQRSRSFNIELFIQTLSTTENILIIQDVDGVCMRLVSDPIARTIRGDYLKATRAFDAHFYVLTNGEHIGMQGINSIVERAVKSTPVTAEILDTKLAAGLYLPGLAAGGVQWQNRDGEVSHPGVTDAELAFLSVVPDLMKDWVRAFLSQHSDIIRSADSLETCLTSSVLDNRIAPSINLNSLYDLLSQEPAIFQALQRKLQIHLEDLINQAKMQGLENSFFIHYTPNFGRDSRNQDIICYSQLGNPGTTDFQFMLRGSLKEAGVLVLLNRYYFQKVGYYPLGAGFNVRQAPRSLDNLLQLVTTHFDLDIMPTIVGVGDTITSHVSNRKIQRGGSDRNFLQLIQNLNDHFSQDNLIVYVNSSGDGLKNRQSLRTRRENCAQLILEGADDVIDPLRLNVVFAQGHAEYCNAFVLAAERRRLT